MIRVASLIVFAAALAAPMARAEDPVLYQYRSWTITDGAAGNVAQFQAGLNVALADCGLAQTVSPDGVLGKGTAKAVTALAGCEAVSEKLEPGSAARKGAVTAALWQIVLPDVPVPGVEARSAALKLTFENTDYHTMQWNFCQNRPRYDPANGQNVCYSNDRASFITWGPNGATAGHGREVQAILSAFLAQNPETNGARLDAAFGGEAAGVRRMLDLNASNANASLEVYLCGVWMSPTRRADWTKGFETFGKTPGVADLYRDVYKSRSFDGGKIATFYSVWTAPEFGLQVTELDHAFFVDRSAHMGIKASALTSALRALKAETGAAWPPSPAEIRRHIALTVRPPNQVADRLGRDAAYYAASIGEAGLTEEERTAWKTRGARNAEDLGLDDTRFMPAFIAAPSLPHPMPKGEVTAEERALCPDAVLNPLAPK